MGRNIVVEETYILSIMSISKSISNSRAKLASRRKLGRFSARATRRVAPAGAQKRRARYNGLGARSKTLSRAVYFGRPLQRAAHSSARARTSSPTSTPRPVAPPPAPPATVQASPAYPCAPVLPPHPLLVPPALARLRRPRNSARALAAAPRPQGV